MLWSFTVNYKEVCFDAEVFCVFTKAACWGDQLFSLQLRILYQAENSSEPAAPSACFLGIWSSVKVHTILNCSFTEGEVLKSGSFLSSGNFLQGLVYS